MQQLDNTMIPRTTADAVFHQLHDEIVTLKLLPGTKISEAEVASRLGVSRQPVRDAFNRLGNMELLSIRPQRATTVRGFSQEKIANARFIRLAVELEVMRRAHDVWDDERAAKLDANLELQRETIKEGRIAHFHGLDYEFHKLICDLSGHPLAFETIVRCKQQVDRLCVLSLGRNDEATAVLADHVDICRALKDGTVAEVDAVVKRHMGRLDGAISEIYENHSAYFE